MGSTYKGNDRALIGFILGLLGFWLFAQTMLNINVEMGKQLSISSSVLNLAVAAAALFSGLFVVVAGNLADRFGRVRILRWGYLFGVVGGGLVACTMPGRLAVPLLIAGRIFQGPFYCLHHALLPGAGEGVLVGCCAAACGELMVYGYLGRGRF